MDRHGKELFARPRFPVMRTLALLLATWLKAPGSSSSSGYGR